MHTLILGTTESGKTSLATELAREFKKQGYSVIVLTSVYDPRWEADFYTEDKEEFLKVFWDSQQCAVFIDEGAETVGRYDDAMVPVVTRGRHWGHVVFIMAQKATTLNLTVREQCARLFLFASAPPSCKIMAEEFNQPGLLEGFSLAQGEYMEARRFGPDGKPYLSRGKVFEPKREVDKAGE